MTGSGGLTKSGTGTMTLTGSNTYTGNTLVSAGKIALGNAAAIQASAFDTSSINGGLDVTGFATPTFGGLTGSVDLSPTLITGYGSVTGLTLNPPTGITNTYSGVIANGAAGMTLTKTGAGTQVLSGSNTYSGATTISAGILQFAKPNAMSASSAVTTGSGATLAVNVGGGTDFTIGSSGNGTTNGLLAGLGGQAGSTVSFAPGSALGLDTTNAGSTVTDSTNLSFVGIGLTKLGTGTLALVGNNSYSGATTVAGGTLIFSGSNSYTGATTVSAGTLEFQSATAMSGSSAMSISSGATLSLRADANTTFTPSSFIGSSGSYTIAVNQLTGAGAGKTLTLANPFTIGSASGNNLTVSSTSSDTLLLSSQLNLANATASSNTITLSGANMTLNAGVNYSGGANGPILTVNANSNTLLINGNWTTGGNRWSGIVINSGTVTMANGLNGGSSTNNGVYAGLNGGTLNLNNNFAIGGAGAGNSFTINGGTLDNTSGTSKTLWTNPAVNINGSFTFSTPAVPTRMI